MGWEIRPPQAGGGGHVNIDTLPGPDVDIVAKDVEDGLSTIKDESFDWVAVGRHIEGERNHTEALRKITKKLRLGGHLIIFLPSYAETEMSTAFPQRDIEEMVSSIGSWLAKGRWQDAGWNVCVYKKLRGSKGMLERRNGGKPRACIARYGALGDAVMLTPLIKQLDEDGYEVTVNVTPYAAPVLQGNPHIANILLQERDCIPNPQLGAYWKLWEKDYDRYINLSESIEGKLLIVEGRRDFYTSKSWRNSVCNVNYYDQTMRLGGYPDKVGTRGELFFTPTERRETQAFRDSLRDRFMVMWALNGSSHHKVYPAMEPTIVEFCNRHSDVVVVTVGDELARLLEFEHPSVICKAGQWPIRMSMAMTSLADVVVGPETAITNAASCFGTPTITLLSHSTHENLCKYWENDFCIAPDEQLSPCYPCHQLHYTKESCPLTRVMDADTGEEIAIVPVCPTAISQQRMLDRLEEVYGLFHKTNQSAAA